MSIPILLVTAFLLLWILLIFKGEEWIREMRIRRAIEKGEDLPYSFFVYYTGAGVLNVDSRAFKYSKEGRNKTDRQFKVLKRIRERREREGDSIRPSSTLGGVEF